MRLGWHSDCHSAVRAAKEKYSQSNGCFYCAKPCHHNLGQRRRTPWEVAHGVLLGNPQGLSYLVLSVLFSYPADPISFRSPPYKGFFPIPIPVLQGFPGLRIEDFHSLRHASYLFLITCFLLLDGPGVRPKIGPGQSGC